MIRAFSRMMQKYVTSAKVIMKWLGDYNIEILDPWTGLSSDFYPMRTCGQSSKGTSRGTVHEL